MNRPCQQCQEKFLTPRQKRFCSRECFYLFSHERKLQSQRNLVVVISKKEWKTYWSLFHQGKVKLETMKNLMPETFTHI